MKQWRLDRGKMYPTLEAAAQRVMLSVGALLTAPQRDALGARVLKEMIVVCEAMAAENAVVETVE